MRQSQKDLRILSKEALTSLLSREQGRAKLAGLRGTNESSSQQQSVVRNESEGGLERWEKVRVSAIHMSTSSGCHFSKKSDPA